MSKHCRWIPTFAGAVLVVLMIALVGYYRGHQEPLSPEEVDHYLRRIESQMHEPGGRHDIGALRRFLAEDDGEPFYTVNLYDFHDQAKYSDGRRDRGTGREAFQRFSEVMLRLLARRASHPIFGSEWVDASASGWDRIVIVRYRSRRDIAEVFASSDFADASAHKWAALERNERMVVQGLHIPELYIPAILIALAGGIWAFSAALRQRPSLAPRSKAAEGVARNIDASTVVAG